MRFGQSILSLKHVKGNGKIPRRFDMPSDSIRGLWVKGQRLGQECNRTVFRSPIRPQL